MEALLSMLGGVLVFGILITLIVQATKAIFIRLGTMANLPGLVSFLSL